MKIINKNLLDYWQRSDTSSQYWMGLVRNQKDRKWKFIGSGEEVTISFWSQPQSTEEDCVRYDGSKGWLWSNTPCASRLYFICQHRKYYFVAIHSHSSLSDTLEKTFEYNVFTITMYLKAFLILSDLSKSEIMYHA